MYKLFFYPTFWELNVLPYLIVLMIEKSHENGEEINSRKVVWTKNLDMNLQYLYILKSCFERQWETERFRVYKHIFSEARLLLKISVLLQAVIVLMSSWQLEIILNLF